jgi:type II secretory pathway pseudopilin PulG
MKLPLSVRRKMRHESEAGYVLMTVLLTVALMIIFTAAILPTIKYQIENDREEEMIHRGVQYARAIRAYYKKFGRYPMKIEDLENTSNLRFLRRRYKDPTNCKNGKCEDFKLLYYGDVPLTMGGGILPVQGPGGSPGVAGPGMVAGPGGGMAGNAGAAALAGMAADAVVAATVATTPAPPLQGTDSSQSSSDNGDQSGGSNGSNASGQPGGQTFGGGPIVGVVSATKCPPHPKDDCEGFREFNHKKKYKEWKYYYDPGTDLGVLQTTPNQPPLVQQQPQNVNGQGTTPSPGGSTTPGPGGFANGPSQPSGTSTQPGSDSGNSGGAGPQ